MKRKGIVLSTSPLVCKCGISSMQPRYNEEPTSRLRIDWFVKIIEDL